MLPQLAISCLVLATAVVARPEAGHHKSTGGAYDDQIHHEPSYRLPIRHEPPYHGEPELGYNDIDDHHVSILDIGV